MEITWFPPSWLLIKTKDKVIYIDPAWIQKNFDKYPKKIIFSHYPEPMDGLPEPDLPKADIILITHHHQDHIKTVALNRLATKSTRVFAPSKCAELIGRPFEVVKPNIVIPMHFLKANPGIFKKEIEKKLQTKTVVLKTGESCEL